MKQVIPISVYLIFFAWLSLSWKPLEKNKPSNIVTTASAFSADDSSNDFSIGSEAASLYNELELADKGLSKSAFAYAYKGYQRLLKKQVIDEPGYLTICDFSQSSKNKRLYLIDMADEKLVLTTYVAHGRNSGTEYATRFSNKPSSLQSSLGFYITSNTYYGEHGLSLRITGLEKGYNDKALQRNIVVHGADYIDENWLHNSNTMGRSYGCPAIPEKESKEIITTIKNGSCLFIYHPSKNYLKGSKILND